MICHSQVLKLYFNISVSRFEFNGRQMTVLQYFQNEKRVRLQYPYLPTLKTQNGSHFPVEVNKQFACLNVLWSDGHFMDSIIDLFFLYVYRIWYIKYLYQFFSLFFRIDCYERLDEFLFLESTL